MGLMWANGIGLDRHYGRDGCDRLKSHFCAVRFPDAMICFPYWHVEAIYIFLMFSLQYLACYIYAINSLC